MTFSHRTKQEGRWTEVIITILGYFRGAEFVKPTDNTVKDERRERKAVLELSFKKFDNHNVNVLL